MFSPTIVVLAILVFLCGSTAGLFWEKRSLSWLLYLFRSDLRILAFVCYGLSAFLAVVGLGFGLVLGGIFGILMMDSTSSDALNGVGNIALITMFVTEFIVVFLFCRFCDRKLFSLPQE